MRALRADPRLIRYIVLLMVGMSVVLGLSAFFPDRFMIAFTLAFFAVYGLAPLTEAYFRRRWTGH
jgi:hypothetical protein